MTVEPEQHLPVDSETTDLCEQLAEVAQRTGRSIATCESLTAGNLAAQLGRAPSSGEWYAGGIVAYSPSVKHSLLHVPDGPVVSEDSARAMAHSTATMFGADLTIALTGEAGPDTDEDVPAGTVWIGIVDRGQSSTERTEFDGDPADVLAATVHAAVQLLLRHTQG
ncbi:CinA family protein [Williamsia deligens]|uniref:CinA family protein n=1 Tax=Williamsia deligens TaxID=321325 RepID=A0ABW3G765_9NOCA|nr:nicotinamide-nucleotide amidohydrolase family protein [Williamsia deligens]MCP2192797.1 nicotinamide-nucleotide amidase [Williamsia deligens]